MKELVEGEIQEVRYRIITVEELLSHCFAYISEQHSNSLHHVDGFENVPCVLCAWVGIEKHKKEWWENFNMLLLLGKRENLNNEPFQWF